MLNVQSTLSCGRVIQNACASGAREGLAGRWVESEQGDHGDDGDDNDDDDDDDDDDICNDASELESPKPSPYSPLQEVPTPGEPGDDDDKDDELAADDANKENQSSPLDFKMHTKFSQGGSLPPQPSSSTNIRNRLVNK
jgi:hypothetical protein